MTFWIDNFFERKRIMAFFKKPQRMIISILAVGLLIGLAACGSEGGSGGAGTIVAAGHTAAVAQPTETADPARLDDIECDECIDGSNIVVPAGAGGSSGFSLPLRGTVVHMNQDIAEVITALGEPLGVHISPSCAFDGYDRIFLFPGVQIHTFPQGERDFVHIISVMDDSVVTEGGIFLGSEWHDVLDAYGQTYEQEFSKFTFNRNGTNLSFFVENDMVIAITYELVL